jgi:glycosyltransferase involved in cell wall biosynthesis
VTPQDRRPLPVLFLDHTSQLGGAERSMLDLLARLDRSRIAPWLATSPGGPLVERAEALGIPVTLMALDPGVLTLSREEWGASRWRFVWRARTFLGEVLRLAALVRREGIAAIHTNTLKAHVLGSLVGLFARVPVVWHMRDLPSSRGDSRKLLALFFALVKPGILAISEAVKADLPAAMRTRTRVVYNGIDLAAFDARAEAPAEGLAVPGGDGPLVGTVSYLIPWKGQEVFLLAARALLDRHPTWRFVVVGDTIFQFREERARLEAVAARLGLGDRLTFAGHREDIPGVMRAFDLFVLPSLYEPFGRVLIEAMGASKAVVASRAGGVPEIVKDGETGLLVEPGDPPALARAIEAVLDDPALRERLAAAGRARVEACFSLEATVRGVEEAYEAFGLLAPREAAGARRSNG